MFIVHWIAGNWTDPWFLTVIGIEIAFAVALLFMPEAWKNAAKQLGKDKRVPAPVRLLIVFGSLPVPGPVDEICLGIGVVIMACSPHMRAAFSDALAIAKAG